MAELLRNYGPAVAWIIAAIGWVVANRQANQREERKEVRSEIEEAAEVAMGILEQLRAYRKTAASSSEAVEAETWIKLKFRELSLRVDRLKDRDHLVREKLLDLSLAEEKIEKFFDIATGEDFESSARQPGPEDGKMLARQATCALAVTDALHRAFMKAFAAQKKLSVENTGTPSLGLAANKKTH